jgi:quercetin dioxygenase-like cupin family protein
VNSPRAVVASVLLVVAAALPPGVLHAQPDENGFIRIQPEQIDWKEVPNSGGVKTAVVAGDPGKPGVYVVRVWFPPGVMSRPHSHPDDRYAIVIKGTWWTGTGETFDPKSTQPVKAGGFMKHPAGAVHYDGAKDEEVILQLIGIGPGGTTYAHPDDGRFGSSK